MISKQLYVSLDIEADGPYPLEYSMRNFGIEVFDKEGNTYGTFERNLFPLPEAKICPKTKENFWDKNPEAWNYVNTNCSDPTIAMKECKSFLWEIVNKTNARMSYAGFPASFDFMWHYIYMVKFTGDSRPLSFSAFDAKTAASIILNIPYINATKRNFPKKWFKGAPAHDHTGLTDAIGQRVLMVNMFKDVKESSSE